MRRKLLGTAAALLAASFAVPAAGQDGNGQLPAEHARFIASNSTSTLYHELGHALIDTMELPMLGKEEDAADIFSVVLIDYLNDGASADKIARDTAQYYLLEDKRREEQGYAYNFSGEHSPYIQRHYLVACLHYGANPSVRQPFLASFTVPDEMIATCAYRRKAAEDGWQWVLRQIHLSRGGGPSVTFREDYQPVTEAEIAARDAIRAEAQYLAESFTLPVAVSVAFADCDGDQNAYYYPDETEIVFCREYAADLLNLIESKP